MLLHHLAAATAMLVPLQIPLVEFEEPQVAGKPLVNPQALADTIQVPALERRAHTLYGCAKASQEDYGHPTRVIGSQGHFKTLEYIYDELDALSDYYDVSTETLTTINGYVKSFSIKDNNGKITAEPLSLTPGTNGTVEGEVFTAGGYGCLASNYKGAKDKVVVVPRGKCAFGEKSEFAGLAGAKALLIYDPEASNDEPMGGDLGMPLGHQVATFGVPKSWDPSSAGKVVVNIDATVYSLDSVNVIAETKGGDHDNVVMLGSHSDSVFAGPGLNDNGSGLNSLLEVAKQLAGFSVTNAVRFAWWTAEEEGLVGSLHYTRNLPQKEARKIRMFLDYDMMASPNYIFEIYDSDDSKNPKGSSAIRDTYIDFYTSKGLNYTLQPFDGRSDYVGFLDIGVPAGGFDAGVEETKSRQEQIDFGGEAGTAFDQCYHQACDNLENLNYDAWLINTQLIAHSLGKWAESLKGFPERDTSRLSTLAWRRAKSDTS